MENKEIELTAPKIERYKDIFSFHNCRAQAVTHETAKLLPALFAEVSKISPVSKTGLRTVHLCADRGPIEDWRDYEEMLDVGDVENRDDYESQWKDWYPKERYWFTFDFMEDNGYYAIALNHRLILQVEAAATPAEFGDDISELLHWLIYRMKITLHEIESGLYNARIKAELAPEQKFGTIERKAFWKLYPEEKEDYFSNLSESDCQEYCELINTCDEDLPPPNLLPKMTSGLFYQACKLGYAANHYEEVETLSPKELYLKYADGRDVGLRDLPEDSAEAFCDWLKNHEVGGHPWEVCRGGNSTHVSLFVSREENGYYFVVDGKSWGRSVEAIQFFLAIHRAGFPVKITHAKNLAMRLTGSDKIGIVPEGIFPRYCESYFPNEEILDFMNLPFENRDEFVKTCVWKSEPQLQLIKTI